MRKRSLRNSGRWNSGGMGRIRVDNIAKSFGSLQFIVPYSALADSGNGTRDESARALGLKGGSGELDESEIPARQPINRISGRKARKNAPTEFQPTKWGFHYCKTDPDSVFLRKGAFQLRFSSTVREAGASPRPGNEDSLAHANNRAIGVRDSEFRTLRRNDEEESGFKQREPAVKKIPPKYFEAARVVWNIHQVLGSMPWGPSVEVALENLDVHLRNHHVSQVLRGLTDPELGLQFFQWCKRQDGYAHDALNYNMMIAILANALASDQVADLIEEMYGQSFELYPDTLTKIIMNYHRANKMPEVLHVFNILQDRGKPPGVGAYACLIDILGQRGDFQLVGEFYSTMRELSLELDGRTYAKLLRAFSRARDTDMVCKLFGEMRESSSCTPNAFAFGSLVRTLAVAGRMDEAMERFREMADSGFTPDVPTYNTVIDCLGKASRTDEACDVLSEMVNRGRTPDVVTYNSLLHHLGKTDRVDHVRALYKEMLAGNVVPDGFTCSILVQALGRSGKMEIAVELFLDMIKTPGMRLDVVMYNTMLNWLGKAGRVKQVTRLFKEMKASGQRPDSFSYNIVMDAMCRGQDLSGANNLLMEMKAAGFRPNVVTYNNLIHSYGKAGKVARASKLFKRMIRDGVAPDQISHNIMINVLGKAGKTNEVLSVLKDMRDRGVSPDVVTYNRVIDTFGAAGDCKAAYSLFREMLENDIAPDRITFTVLINALANNRRIEGALSLYREMRDRGLRPDVVTYHCLMTGYIREGRIAEANELLIRLKGSKVKPTATTYGILIDANARYNKNEMVVKLREERNDAGFTPEWNRRV